MQAAAIANFLVSVRSSPSWRWW